VNQEKLSIAKNVAYFVGFKFSEAGIQYNPMKIDASQYFPLPPNVKERRSFLGMCNQLGGFVHDLSMATRLLTDASRKHGLGFIMQEQHGNDWKLVQAGSRYINKTEAGYS